MLKEGVLYFTRPVALWRPGRENLRTGNRGQPWPVPVKGHKLPRTTFFAVFYGGNRITWTFTPPGLYPYICSRHDALGLAGTVIVRP